MPNDEIAKNKTIWLLKVRNRFVRKAGLSSIQGRLTAIAFFFIVATAVTMGVASYRFTFAFESQRFHDHFNLLATYMANNAELGVLLDNEEILARLSNSMLNVTDVQCVTILDNNDEIIIHKEQPQQESAQGQVSAPVSTVITSEEPFFSHGETDAEKLGMVVIGYSLSSLSQLQRLLAQRFAIISLLLSLVPVIMYWMLSRAINAPMTQLVQVSKQVSRGHMDVRADGGSLQETRTLARALNEMLDALETRRRELSQANAAMAKQQVLAEVGKFSMIVAHEIKNPLAIIKGSLAILGKKETVDPAIKQRMINYADDEVQRIDKLIEDFLLFSRPRSPEFQLVLAQDLIGKIIQKIVLISAEINIVRPTADLEQTTMLQCDIPLFERALFNIVRNAIEASKEANQVQIKIACTPPYLIFSVYDSGGGVDLKQIKRIFEPFFSTKAKGTGLGLAIVKEVIKAHNGKVSVKNIKSAGACFTLKLPLEPQEKT
jgi:signal transduction histidine kinase